MRIIHCVLEDGYSGAFTKEFAEAYGYTKDTALLDAFSALMPHRIYNGWINNECDCFALYENRYVFKINVDDSLSTLLKPCDDERTHVLIRILVDWHIRA